MKASFLVYLQAFFDLEKGFLQTSRRGIQVNFEDRVVRETRSKILALVAEAALQDFINSDGYVQVSYVLTLDGAVCILQASR